MSLSNYIETEGQHLLGEDQLIRTQGAKFDEAAYALEQALAQDNPPEDLLKLIEEGRQLLRKPFTYYTMQLSLSMDQQIDIIYRQVVRYYQQRILDMKHEREQMEQELAEFR